MRALGLLLALVALVASACGGEQRAQETTAPPAETEPATETTAQPRDASRPAAPPIEGETLDGELLSLADFRGRPVLVNVWSSW
jgi:hypothetical protein